MVVKCRPPPDSEYRISVRFPEYLVTPIQCLRFDKRLRFTCGLTLELSGGEAVRLERVVRR